MKIKIKNGLQGSVQLIIPVYTMRMILHDHESSLERPITIHHKDMPEMVKSILQWQSGFCNTEEQVSCIVMRALLVDCIKEERDLIVTK